MIDLTLRRYRCCECRAEFSSDDATKEPVKGGTLWRCPDCASPHMETFFLCERCKERPNVSGYDECAQCLDFGITTEGLKEKRRNAA